VDDDSIDLIFQQKGGGAVVRSSRLKAQTGARSSSRLILSAINGAIRVKNSRISIGPVFTPACYSKGSDDVESGCIEPYDERADHRVQQDPVNLEQLLRS
jgi:hypothetical protein